MFDQFLKKKKKKWKKNSETETVCVWHGVCVCLFSGNGGMFFTLKLFDVCTGYIYILYNCVCTFICLPVWLDDYHGVGGGAGRGMGPGGGGGGGRGGGGGYGGVGGVGGEVHIRCIREGGRLYMSSVHI